VKTEKERRFCQACGLPLSRRVEDGLERDYCPRCRRFYYSNPLPVVSAICPQERSILLVKRGRAPYRGRWCLPTGFAETGESIEEAALRELEEETGITGRVLGLVDVCSYRSRFYGDLLFVTFEVEETGGVLKGGSDTVAARYFPVDGLPSLPFLANRRAVTRYRKDKAEYWAIVDSFRDSVSGGGEGRRRPNLLSDRLVEVIEENAASIARRWMEEALTHPSTAGYRLFNQERLFSEVGMILSHFGDWLGGRYGDGEIRDYYTAFGRRSRRQGVPLSHVLSALSLVKKHLWEFALSRGMWGKTIDIYMTLELDRRIVVFFDKAAFHTARGYES